MYWSKQKQSLNNLRSKDPKEFWNRLNMKSKGKSYNFSKSELSDHFKNLASAVQMNRMAEMPLISGEFPEEWAVGIIVILFKGGEKNDLNNYYQISNRTLKISQYNYKNISRYYHTSFQGSLVNFLPPVQNITNMITVGSLNFERSKIFTPPKFVPPKFLLPIENFPT